MGEAAQPLAVLPKHTGVVTESSGLASHSPQTPSPPRLLRYCVASGGPQDGMNGCLWDLFGQQLSWRVRSESRLGRQIGRPSTFFLLAGYTVTFLFGYSFFPLPHLGAVKVYPRRPWQCQKRPSDSRKLQLERRGNKPTKHGSPSPPRQMRYGSLPPRKKGNPWPPCIGTGDQGRKTLNSARRSGSTI